MSWSFTVISNDAVDGKDDDDDDVEIPESTEDSSQLFFLIET